jgi:hypothetical protein
MNKKTLIAIVMCGIIVSTLIFGAYEFGAQTQYKEGYKEGHDVGYNQGYASGVSQGSRFSNVGPFNGTTNGTG